MTRYLNILQNCDKKEAAKTLKKIEEFKKLEKGREWAGKKIDWESICDYLNFPITEAFVKTKMTSKFSRCLNDLKILSLTGCVTSKIW